MTPEQHEEFLFTFVKNSGLFKFNYLDSPLENQKIIGIIADDKDGKLPLCQEMQDLGYAVIDPNWDLLYQSFLSIDFNDETLEYVKRLVEQDVSSVIISIIKEMINSNIDSEKVYVVVSDSWDKDWLDETIEV